MLEVIQTFVETAAEKLIAAELTRRRETFYGSEDPPLYRRFRQSAVSPRPPYHYLVAVPAR